MPDVHVQSRAGLKDGPTSPGSGSVVMVVEKPPVCESVFSFSGLGGGSPLEADLMLIASPGGSAEQSGLQLISHTENTREWKK